MASVGRERAAAQRGGRGPSTGLLIAHYLRELGPLMTAPRLARREWMREVSGLIDQARVGDPIALYRRAGRHGRTAAPVFREARRRLDALDPPPECAAIHQATGRWLSLHVEACEALIRTEAQGTPRALREVHERLVESREHARRFNAEYANLVAQLRAQVAAASAERGREFRPLARLRWLFGPRG